MRQQLIRVPGGLTLTAPEGTPCRFADLLGAKFTVVQLVPDFGCQAGLVWLLDLDRAADRLAGLDTGVAAVGGSAQYQARLLREEEGVSMPLLLDPIHELRQVVQATRSGDPLTPIPRAEASYARSMMRGFPPQMIASETVTTPCVLVVDREGGIRWCHIGSWKDDYPQLDKVFETVARLS